MTTGHAVPRAGLRPRPQTSVAAVAVVGSAAAAWLVLVLGAPNDLLAGAGHHDHFPGVVDPLSPGWVAVWLLMVVAMMWPLAVPTLTAVNRSSYRGWRTRLGVVCLATVTLLWLAVGLLGGLLAQRLAVPTGALWWQAGWLAVAVAATASARRSRLLWQCLEAPPLAPGGRRGVVSAARAGVASWRRCALLCGPVMAAMLVGHSLLLMGFASLAVWWEAWHPRAWRDPVPPLLLTTGALTVVVTSALASGAVHG